MAHDLLHDCPVCKGQLHITKLQCPSCGTSIEGDFQAERLFALSPEQRSFIFSFLRTRGNIREMEKELGLSYPTVRSRLEQVITALGLEPVPTPAQARESAVTRKEILEMLARGEIDQQQALEMMNK